MKPVLRGVLLIGCLLAAPLTAQPVVLADLMDCDWRARAEAIPEPWDDFSTTFASGEVRIALLDLIEPAAGSVYLMILSPPYSELGDRQCRLIGYKGQGFSGADFGTLEASYDPSDGLTFKMEVGVPNQDFTEYFEAELRFGIDQRLGPYDPKIEVAQ